MEKERWKRELGENYSTSKSEDLSDDQESIELVNKEVSEESVESLDKFEDLEF